MNQKTMVLIILDGWGEGPPNADNAIAHAKKPTWDRLLGECPHSTLSASGIDVGLPPGQMGNSEVGHLCIGSGRALLQDLGRINVAIQNGDFDRNTVLVAAFKAAEQKKRAVHVLALLSSGGVHSHEDHLYAAIQLAAKQGISQIWIHAFLDGRDTPPSSAKASILQLQKVCSALPASTRASIASISGRYYAMDRDKRWERTQRVYELLTESKAGWSCPSALEALVFAYKRGETDEFVMPTRIGSSPPIHTDDLVLFMNFRADRARQLSAALSDPHFTGFVRQTWPASLPFVTLTEYDSRLKAQVAFPKITIRPVLGEILAAHGLKQLRIAETEKYAHVTFFFNAGLETPFAQEDRILIPSKKEATYDQCPTMSAFEITEALCDAIKNHRFDVIICNYANADMVGHTGNFPATVQAIETLDQCLAKVCATLEHAGGELIITADHGNADCLFDPQTHQAHTAHTTARVPFVYVGKPATLLKEQGTLKDIAPTMLQLLGLPIPPEMSGTPLIALKKIGEIP